MNMKLSTAALIGLTTTSCVTFQTVTLGMAADDNLAAPRVTALACINNLGGANGNNGTLREGQLGGAPAVAIDGVGPWGTGTPVLVERRSVGTMAVWVGHRCRFVPGSAQGANCENSALFENGQRRVYLWAEHHYATSTEIPQTVEAIIAPMVSDRLPEMVASIDVSDPASQAAFAELQHEQFWKALEEGIAKSLPQLVAGATAFAAASQFQANVKYNMAKPGDSAKVSQQKQEGWRKGAELNAQAASASQEAGEKNEAAAGEREKIVIDPGVRAFFEAHPKFVPVEAVLAAFSDHGRSLYMCIDRPGP